MIEFLAILCVLAVIAAAWFNHRRVAAEVRARDAVSQLETVEAIEELKRKIKTDTQAAEVVNDAWSSPP